MIETTEPVDRDHLAHGSVVTIGNFDGVHRGHRALIDGACAEARVRGLPAVALTFEPHPATFFRGRDPASFRLQSSRERAVALRDAGIDVVATVAFSADFAALSPRRFIEDVVCGELGARGVHVGYDFTFGQGRGGTVETLQALGDELGFAVTVHARRDEGEAAISSTRLRAAVHAGDLAAWQMLTGRRWSLLAQTAAGAARGRTIGVPTVNQYPEGRLLPPFGVYATRLQIGADVWPAISNLGVRPTFEGDPRVSMETHAIDAALPAIEPGTDASVVLVGFVRPERRFDGVDALRAQIAADIEVARALLAAEAPHP